MFYSNNTTEVLSIPFADTFSASWDSTKLRFAPTIGNEVAPTPKHEFAPNSNLRTNLSDVKTNSKFRFLKEYRYWSWMPRYWRAGNGVVVHSVVFGDRRIQWLKSTTLNILSSLYYYFLEYFTLRFREESWTSRGRFGLFVVYILIGTVFRVVIKRIGLSIDLHKCSTASLYFIGEVMCLLFYYTFYRVLFESLHSWPWFFLTQLAHLGSEWLLYVARGSESMFSLSQSLKSSILLSCLSDIITPYDLTHRDWVHFICLDFGIRCCVMISTGLGVLLLLLTINYLPWITNSLKESNAGFGTTSALIGVAIALEAANACLINHFFFRRKNLDVWVSTCHCFADAKFAFLSTIIACNLFINPMYAFTTDKPTE